MGYGDFSGYTFCFFEPLKKEVEKDKRYACLLFAGLVYY